VNVVVKNFKRGDLGKIKPTKDCPMDRDSHYYPRMEELGRTMYEEGSEIPIAAWGMQPQGEGVATVWAEFSEVALMKYPVALAKNVRRHLDEHVEKLNLHRVQSVVEDGDEVSARWSRWLGFEPERRFVMYARTIS
jgi:hypothetical protein